MKAAVGLGRTRRPGAIIASMALTVGLIVGAAPATAIAEPPVGAAAQAEGVTFFIGSTPASGSVEVEAGSVLRIAGVPVGSTVALVDESDPSITYPIAQTEKPTTWRSDALPPSVTMRAVVTAPDASVAELVIATGAPNAARDVAFFIGDQQITAPREFPAGSVLTIARVPDGSRVELVDARDPSITFAMTQQSKPAFYKSGQLRPSTRFQATVTAPDGSEAQATFTTAAPLATFSGTAFPAPGRYGIAMPLRVTFSRPVTDREAVERALVVRTNKEIGPASWHWVSSSMAVFRPRDFWPGNTKIVLDANLEGIQGAPGVWGRSFQHKFSTGDAVVMKTDFRSHRMTFVRNGQTVRTFPISGGKAGWLTASGIKVVTERHSPKRLYNPGPNGWDVTVRWGLRITDDGEYIHDAPWNWAIGYANTSHGCTNMTVYDMQWVWQNTRIGDPVVATGTASRAGKYNYLGGYWNYTWGEWRAGSAIKRESPRS